MSIANRGKTVPIHYEWYSTEGTHASRCWNSPFWYGNGEAATEESVIMRKSDYELLTNVAQWAQRVLIASIGLPVEPELAGLLGNLNLAVRPIAETKP
jgi:hypothetical protein